MADLPQKPVVYVDANPFMYALEGAEDLAAALRELFAGFRQGLGIAVISELTLAEVLPKRKILDRHFLDLLVWSKIFDLRPITRDVLIETAEYRRISATKLPDGRLALPKLPDAIHVVTAIRSQCGIFPSSDTRIKLPQGMKLVNADRAGIEALTRELA
jgi:predicted nucleic acid-binding protein